jgi:hypothetical protein
MASQQYNLPFCLNIRTLLWHLSYKIHLTSSLLHARGFPPATRSSPFLPLQSWQRCGRWLVGTSWSCLDMIWYNPLAVTPAPSSPTPCGAEHTEEGLLRSPNNTTVFLFCVDVCSLQKLKWPCYSFESRRRRPWAYCVLKSRMAQWPR